MLGLHVYSITKGKGWVSTSWNSSSESLCVCITVL